MFSVHAKTQSRRFQIPPIWKAFSKSSFSCGISVDGRSNCRNKILWHSMGAALVPHSSWIGWFVWLFAHLLLCRCVSLCLVSHMGSFYSHHLLKLCGGNDRVVEELFDSTSAYHCVWDLAVAWFCQWYSTQETANQKALSGYAVSMKRLRPRPQAPEEFERAAIIGHFAIMFVVLQKNTERA